MELVNRFAVPDRPVEVTVPVDGDPHHTALQPRERSLGLLLGPSPYTLVPDHHAESKEWFSGWQPSHGRLLVLGDL